MESQVDDSYFSASKGRDLFVFVIDFSDPRAIEPAAPAGKGRPSIIVRIELEYALFTLSAMEPERATKTFAEALAKQTALLAIEKDFPNGVEPSLSAEQIDYIPAECEHRLPDLCVNGNNAWLVDPRTGNGELFFARRQMYSGYAQQESSAAME
jgi:hypothetical protein